MSTAQEKNTVLNDQEYGSVNQKQRSETSLWF